MNNAHYVLKSLFLSHNGLNKGFMQFMNKKKMDKEYEDVFKNFFTKPTIELISDLHELCSKKPNVDEDIMEIVNDLYRINCGDD